jgi:hypothetical protein
LAHIYCVGKDIWFVADQWPLLFNFIPNHRKNHSLPHTWDRHDYHKLRNHRARIAGQAFCELLYSPHYSHQRIVCIACFHSFCSSSTDDADLDWISILHSFRMGRLYDNIARSSIRSSGPKSRSHTTKCTLATQIN